MASFQSLIAPAVEALKSTKTVKDRKDHDDIKVLSPFIIGGVSKMTRPDFDNLLAALERFTPDSPHLDAEQSAVVSAPFWGHIRVVAGAGSGKTTTIIARIKRLMTITTPASICVLTFNVKSRDNLIERLTAAFGFAVKFPVYTVDKYARDHLAAANSVSVKEYCGAAARLPQDVLDNMAYEYQYVFFDEFQDVNEEQFALVRNLARGAPTCVVGDDLQNIYQFRGTNNYYIINYDKMISGVNTFLITRNYRSAAKIVDIANIVAGGISDRIHKTLKCTRGGAGGDYAADTDVEFCHNTAKYVCDQICEQIRMGAAPASIAVLARNKVPLVKIESEFARRGIVVTARLDDYAADETTGRVVLSTIHRAKGLEWDTVYLVGLQDRYFPSHVDGGIKNINEERRLFYVAVTRAKNQLTFVVSDEGEHPAVSRFLHEIAAELPGWAEIPVPLLRYDDRNAERPCYPVTKVVEALQGAHLTQMRAMGLLPTISAAKTAFCEPSAHTPELSAAALEADYGNYCDAYLTRKLQSGVITDPSVGAVLAGTGLSPDEHRALPAWFRDQLEKSYAEYRRGGDGVAAVYAVSLCPRICDGRNRLVYRDVRAIFDTQTAELRDNYAQFLQTDLAAEPSEHKIRLEYNAGKKIVGVLDFITDDAVVEIKCSSAELETEWVLQLLLYRALLEVNGYPTRDRLVVANILRGEISTMYIPAGYDSRGLLDYVTGVIMAASARDLPAAAPDRDLDLDYINGGADDETAVTAAPVEWSRRPDAAGFVAIDVENNTVTGRITEIGAYCGGAAQPKRSWNIAGAVIDWRAADIIHSGEGTPVPFRAAIGELLDILAGVTVIIGHGIGTDLTKLTNNILVAAPEYLGAWRQMLACTAVFDTLPAAKKWRTLPNYKLGTVYEAVTGKRLESAHNAAEDAVATAVVFVAVAAGASS